MFRLVDAGWDQELTSAVALRPSEVCVIAPFIKERAARRLLAAGVPKSLRVITRFSVADMARGVSDPPALRLLLEKGAQIRGVRNLHAKAYLFGEAQAVVTPANLTEAALTRNHEFGFVAEDPTVVRSCRAYFTGLWDRAGTNLDLRRLAQWETLLAKHHREASPTPDLSGLPDNGVDLGAPPEVVDLPAHTQEVRQGFVKFFGEGHDRFPHDTPVLTEVDASESHYACTYPKSRRPRGVPGGATMYLARLAKEPHDIVIYGRSIALAHDEQHDVASAAEIKRRKWKAEWPNYIRVHSPEFVAGTLRNGVSLNALMAALGSASFATTERNAAKGSGNVNPRRSYRQQPQVELSERGLRWVHAKLEAAFERSGRIPAADLAKLYWPSESTRPIRARP